MSGTELIGVRADEGPSFLIEDEGRWIIRVQTECGYNATEIDLEDLLKWLQINRPDLLDKTLS